MISAIVAVDNDWGIGYNGDLLEHIPEDLKFFKDITLKSVVIMGKKTWDSLPVKPLPGRTNVVVDYDYCYDAYISHNKPALVNCDMEHCIQGITNPRNSNENMFVIGGGSIYKQLLPYCDQVYVTKIYKDHENIDTYFPNLDETNEWVVSPISEIKEYNGIPYQFLKYKRIG